MAAFSLARRLRAGETVYCGWCALASPILAEVAARDGFSAVAIDMQHGMWDFAGAVTGIGAINGAGAAPIVRVPYKISPMSAARSTWAPRVSSRRSSTTSRTAEIRRGRQVSAARRAQLGTEPRDDARSVRGRKNYLRDANDMTVTIAMIETREALTNVDAIAAVKGIDVLFVGPSDLSITTTDGAVLDPHSKEVDAALDKIVAAAKKAGKVAGLYCASGERAAAMARRGFGYLGGRQRPRLFPRGHRRPHEGAKGLVRRDRRELWPHRLAPRPAFTSMTR